MLLLEIETPQLPVTLFLGSLPVHLRLGALNIRVIAGMGARRLNILPVMELLLPLPLLDLRPLACLTLLRTARRGLQVAIVLLHAKTQRVLLLLAHQLLLVQRPPRGILGAVGRHGRQSRQARQDRDIEPP